MNREARTEQSHSSHPPPLRIELPFLAPASASTTVRVELADRLERDVMRPARSISRVLMPVRELTVRPGGSCIWRDDSRSWYFASYLDDPLALVHDDRVPVPRAQIAALSELFQAGVHCDLIWIGHELPPGWKPGDPLAPPPARFRQRRKSLDTAVANIVKGTRSAAKGVERVGRVIEITTLGATAVTVAVAAGVVATAGAAAGSVGEVAGVAAPLLVGLDPVVWGGIEHPSGAVTWVELVRWDWQ